MKIILCGYHWTGCKALELLLEKGYDVYVYTHKTENCAADLEGLCRKKGIGYSLDKIELNNMPFIPEVICSIYYRYLIKIDVIEAVGGKIFNLHPALLPKYRGCSSLTWAMINGETECGFTYHYIEAGCDTGNIILQKKIKIEDFDTQLTLYNRVMFESMQYFMKALQLVMEGCPGRKQDGEATQYQRGCPMGGELTDDMDAEMQERFVRAMCYPPYPAAMYNGCEIKTYRDLEEIAGGGHKLIIYGCGGHARSVVNVIRQFTLDIEIILVDEYAAEHERILACDVKKEYILNPDDRYILAIGDNKHRRELYESLLRRHLGKCVSVVSNRANIGMDVVIGQGVFVAANAYVGPQAQIGDNTIINSGSIIEHEVSVGNHTHIAPNSTVCGRTKIRDNVFCGAGSTIIDGITICDDVMIGAGAVVKEDILLPGIYAGVPARKVG